MSKVADKLLFEALRNYLTVYLPLQRCSSIHTIRTYKTALNGLLEYAKLKYDVPLYEITFSMLSKETVVDYLFWLENEKNCTATTKNLRLVAIRAFFSYAAADEVTICPLLLDIQKIPKQKCEKRIVEYMSEEAVKALLSQPDTTTTKGIRDQFLMVLLYDTGARIQEIMNMRICDFSFGNTPTVKLHGKGSKIRIVPLMEKTVKHYERYVKLFHPTQELLQYLFYTVIKGKTSQMTTENARKIMRSYAHTANVCCPEVPLRLHPHLLRHSRAMHLYQHGMDLSLISQWLGHSAIETTLIYAHADTEQKRAAIEKAMGNSGLSTNPMGDLPKWKDDEDLISRLYGLK